MPDAEESSKWMLKKASMDGATTDVIRNFEEMVERRVQREPVQYVIGDWDFYGLTLRCRAPVLIPRPETESLVEAILLHHRSRGPPAHFMDIGCGTGAIGLALLQQWPQSRCVFVDVSPDAIALTEENAAMNALDSRISTQLLDITMETPVVSASTPLDMIVSNPPYIPSAEMKALEVELGYEDPRALDGGADGLVVAKHIVAKSESLLLGGGGGDGGTLWLELDEGHPTQLAVWLESRSGAAGGRVPLQMQRAFADLAGRERFAELSFSAG